MYDPKQVTALEVAVAYFMTRKVTVTFFDLVYDPKGHKVIRGHRDLLYDRKVHGDLFGRFDLDFDPKRSQGH